MNDPIKIAVLGGDMRQVCAAEWLKHVGCAVKAWGLCASSEEVESASSAEVAVGSADVLLLPLPLSRDRLQVNGTDLSLGGLLSMLRAGTAVFCGLPQEEFIRAAEEQGAEVIDYNRDEIFQLRNAQPTAEGAVAVAMSEMRRTLFGSRVLVVGYGRIAKLLSDLLIRMGALVTVAARKETDLTLASMHGCRSLPLRRKDLSGEYQLPVVHEQYHVIFNTVPVRLIDERILRQLPRETVLIDLASLPGGIDYDAAGRLGLKTVIALSLPGKLTPITAGEIIAGRVTAYVEGGCNT